MRLVSAQASGLGFLQDRGSRQLFLFMIMSLPKAADRQWVRGLLPNLEH